jgi:transposase
MKVAGIDVMGLQLQRLQLIDPQMAGLNSMIAAAMKAHQDAVIRLAEAPGLEVDSAQQIIAEVGAQASTFPSPAELTSWVGTCPGKEESPKQNHRSRSAKGNKYLRRVLNQAAHAAMAKKGSHFQAVFRRLLPRLGYQSALWAVAHRRCRLVWKILHVRSPIYRARPRSRPSREEKTCSLLARALRKLGYEVTIIPINQLAANPVV